MKKLILVLALLFSCSTAWGATFGNTDIGTYGTGIGGPDFDGQTGHFSVGKTLTENGLITSISGYMIKEGAGTGDKDYRFAIWADDGIQGHGGTLLGYTETGVLLYTDSTGWKTLNMTTPLNLTTGVYHIGPMYRWRTLGSRSPWTVAKGWGDLPPKDAKGATYIVDDRTYFDNPSNFVAGGLFDDVGNFSIYATYTPQAPAPVADFTATPLKGRAPLSVQFTDTSTNTPTSWTWSFGDGNVSNDQNPLHIYRAGGTPDVSLTATNAVGSDTETKTDYITVLAPANFVFWKGVSPL